ncbi:unnamed protein product [Cuscuta epithymum]|uniref:Transposase (putative) gypsy type domain-containing protein n=1 Tax=Cuscuta epithymum TaxID=186058 RepID=A0AAV0EUL8_9ASTE|nr:unnamed protein product [Cuscuta epithymum]
MLMVHLDSIKSGLQFPLHQFYLDFFHRYQVVPAQFMPNSFRFISAFIAWCSDMGVDPSLDLFLHFFKVSRQNSDGFLRVSARPGRRLFHGAPTSFHDWKHQFFFLRFPEGRFLERWNGYSLKIGPPSLTDGLEEAINKLKKGGSDCESRPVNGSGPGRDVVFQTRTR